MSDREKPPIENLNDYSISQELASRAIETARKVIEFIEPAPPLYHRTPDGIHIDIPILYQGFVLDIIHYDIAKNSFLPKGKPHVKYVGSIDEKAIMDVSRKLFGELRVLDAAEYREPERAWIIPIAWRSFIVAHLKISHDGKNVIPDYRLTGELKRKMF